MASVRIANNRNALVSRLYRGGNDKDRCKAGTGPPCSCNICIRIYNRESRRSQDHEWSVRQHNNPLKQCTHCNCSGHSHDECASYVDYYNEFYRLQCKEMNR
jgi:hypothetical protein